MKCWNNGVDELAARLGLSVAEILTVAGRIDLVAPGRISAHRRGRRVAVSIESFAERSHRLGDRPWARTTHTLAEPEEVLRRLDKPRDVLGSLPRHPRVEYDSATRAPARRY